MALAVRVVPSPELSSGDRARLRRLLDDAFGGDFTDADWDHALGGWHVVATDDGEIIAHAAGVPRRLQVGDQIFLTGYVEAVAVESSRQRAGLGSSVMRRANDIIEHRFEMGGLSSGRQGFYARLGWQRWAGPTYVREPDGRLVRTRDEADVMLRLMESEAALDVLTNGWFAAHAGARRSSVSQPRSAAGGRDL